LLTGSWDCSVKIWKIINGNLGSKPIVEFYDLENSVHVVDIDNDGLYAAAGSDDGSLYVWDIMSQSILFSHQISKQSSRYLIIIFNDIYIDILLYIYLIYLYNIIFKYTIDPLLHV
jgi:WD40 repeat protein